MPYLPISPQREAVTGTISPQHAPVRFSSPSTGIAFVKVIMTPDYCLSVPISLDLQAAYNIVDASLGLPVSPIVLSGLDWFLFSFSLSE
jgi:hypothetical protein